MTDDIFVGIDVAHDMLDMVVSAAGLVWRYPNEPASIDRLIDAVTAWSPALVLLKSRDGHEFDVTCALQAAGLAVLVVSSEQARVFAVALGEPFGDEGGADARMLAALAAALYQQPGREQFAKPLGADALQRMQALVQRHRQLLALLVAEYQLLSLSHPSVRKGVEQTIGFLKGQIASIERHCAAHQGAHRAPFGDMLHAARRTGRNRAANGANGANGLLRSLRLK
jgi:transposase